MSSATFHPLCGGPHNGWLRKRIALGPNRTRPGRRTRDATHKRPQAVATEFPQVPREPVLPGAGRALYLRSCACLRTHADSLAKLTPISLATGHCSLATAHWPLAARTIRVLEETEAIRGGPA